MDGHLCGHIELGTFGLVLSTAVCALVLPLLLTVSMGAGWRKAVRASAKK